MPDSTMQLTTDPCRLLTGACVSVLDCIFIDGYGDAQFATQTQDNVTELLRVDPATRSVYTVACIEWPLHRGGSTRVRALDLRRHAPGVVPPIRNISPADTRAAWFHTAMSVRKDVYERYIVRAVPSPTNPLTDPPTNVAQRTVITRKLTRNSVLGSSLALIGLDSPAHTREQQIEIHLTRDGSLREDCDIVLGAVLMLVRKGGVHGAGREWKDPRAQSELSKEQIEECISVSKLRINQKWEDGMLEGSEQEESLA